MRLRVGRKLGRTVYRQVGGVHSDDDVLVGVMDDAGMAAEVVWCFNEAQKPPKVHGHCPRCGNETLFLDCGYVRCSWSDCPDRDSVADMLMAPAR